MKMIPLFLYLLLLASCGGNHAGKTESATIQVLKEDLEIKEMYARNLSYILQGKAEEGSRVSVTKLYLLQKPLYEAYKNISMTESNSLTVKSLHEAYLDAREFKIIDSKRLEAETLQDSMDFYLFKNRFLSRVIELQMKLVERLPVICGFDHYSHIVIPAQQVYKEGDSFSVRIVPASREKNIVLRSCVLLKNGVKIANLPSENEIYSFGPLEKGNYTLEVESVRASMANTHLRDENGYDERSTHEFVVK